jgi:chemotaxis protein histidine kinase CheA
MTKPAFEMITPRNTLREKVGGRVPALDASALARAEAALKSLSGSFQAWMEEEVEKLETARHAAKAAGYTDQALQDLYSRAHDAKGMGTTYEYPLITRIAAALCRLLETEERRAIAAKDYALIEAHVDACRAAVRGHIKDENHPVGKALAAELDGRVAKVLAVAG